MIHLDEDEKKMVENIGISVAHCPSANMKLGSGVAPIAEYLRRDITVGLGADGAPCNNALSVFFEMKLASLLQKGTNHNPKLLTPEETLSLVSINGAEILLKNGVIGQIKEGFEADLVLLDMDTPQTFNFEKNPAAAIVFGADARNVFATMVRGKFLFYDGEFSNEIKELCEYFFEYSR